MENKSDDQFTPEIEENPLVKRFNEFLERDEYNPIPQTDDVRPDVDLSQISETEINEAVSGLVESSTVPEIEEPNLDAEK